MWQYWQKKGFWPSLIAALMLTFLACSVNAQERSTPVYFYAWGGNPAINDYLRWSARELRAEGIELKHVKVADIAEVVKQLAEGQSNADLLWINGENFHQLKRVDALMPIVDEIKAVAKVNPKLNWQIDFGEPVTELEVPWGVGQFHLLTRSDQFEDNQVDAAELLAFAKANVGRVSYPKPPEFHGTTFLKALLLTLTDASSAFSQPVDSVEAASITAPLWEYLDELHPHLWQRGKNFPSSAAEQLNGFANGVFAIAPSFNPNEARTLVAQGRLPAGVKRVVLGDGAITNHHYLAIPKSAKNQAAAKRVIEFMLSEPAQAQKARLDGWGDPAVVILDANRDSDTLGLLPVADEFHASWQLYLEQAWSARYQTAS